MAGKVAHKKIYTPVCPPVDAQANGLPLGNEITSQYGATRVYKQSLQIMRQKYRLDEKNPLLYW